MGTCVMGVSRARRTSDPPHFFAKLRIRLSRSQLSDASTESKDRINPLTYHRCPQNTTAKSSDKRGWYGRWWNVMVEIGVQDRRGTHHRGGEDDHTLETPQSRTPLEVMPRFRSAARGRASPHPSASQDRSHGVCTCKLPGSNPPIYQSGASARGKT